MVYDDITFTRKDGRMGGGRPKMTCTGATYPDEFRCLCGVERDTTVDFFGIFANMTVLT